MNLVIDLDVESERRLKRAAKRKGVEPAAYAKQIIEEHLPVLEEPAADQRTLSLLAQWDSEDATEDSKEIAKRQNELDEFKQTINQNRAQSEGPNARKIYP